MSIIPKLVALIPARSGSKRLPGKNIRRLAGHPLIAYTIAAALESKIFAKVVVSTDSKQYAEIAEYYGAEVPLLRPSEFAGDLSPDIEWVEYMLKRLQAEDKTYDCFSILRPTSPFRQSETIRRAWKEFLAEEGIDSLRAIEKCKQHPGKMWLVQGKRMTPFLPQDSNCRPWHSSQYQSLPEVYIQNASLEIAWVRVVFEKQTIAGNRVVPFFTCGYEGFDLHDIFDWKFAEELLQNREARLPLITKAPYAAKRLNNE